MAVAPKENTSTAVSSNRDLPYFSKNKNGGIENEHTNGSGDGNDDEGDINNNSSQLNDHEHSPEAAGVARGATRAAQKSIIGRLPKSSGSSSSKSVVKAAATRISKTKVKPTVAAKGAVQKGGGRLIRRQVRGSGRAAGRSTGSGVRSVARRRAVARASDRVSKGADIIGSAVESDETSPPKENLKKNTDKNTKATNGSNAAVETARMGGENKMSQRILSFSGALIKNTILGMAVFESYEHTIHTIASTSSSLNYSNPIFSSLVSNENEKYSNSDNNYYSINIKDNHGCDDNDDFSRTLVSHHFLAGFLGGTAHAVISKMFAAVEKAAAAAATTNTMSFFKAGGGLPMVLHHAVSHSILFGSYEWIKRLLKFQWEQDEADEGLIGGKNLNEATDKVYLKPPELTLKDDNDSPGSNGADDRLVTHEKTQQQIESVQINLDKNDYDDLNNSTISDDTEEETSDTTYVEHSQLIAIAIAGGMAGSLQHIASHYTESFLPKEKDIMHQSSTNGQGNISRNNTNMTAFVGNNNRVTSKASFTSKHKAANDFFPRAWRKLPPPPSLPSTFWAFLPSAIGFVAFEFGKDFVEPT